MCVNRESPLISIATSGSGCPSSSSSSTSVELVGLVVHGATVSSRHEQSVTDGSDVVHAEYPGSALERDHAPSRSSLAPGRRGPDGP